jgi:DNA mismatch endonuclease (patch repair protein)
MISSKKVIIPDLGRSANMRAVRSRNTTPELAVRRLAHKLGLRFRLHQNNLPGRPDLMLSRWKTVIFVHGCFWHQHPGCKKATIPKTNHQFWKAKLLRNVERDRQAIRKLTRLGWKVLTIWECQTHDSVFVTQFLDSHFYGVGRQVVA